MKSEAIAEAGLSRTQAYRYQELAGPREANLQSAGKAAAEKYFAKEARDRRIFEMWLACYTNVEIGEHVGITEAAVRQIIEETADLPKLRSSEQAEATHATDFDPPLYNVWKQQTRTPGSAHFGNSEARWVDNLLYLYTQSFDIVVDPFAGGGSTIDVCRKRFRRYWVSDRKPIVERPAAGRALPDRTRQDAVDDAQALGRRQTWRVSPIGRARGAGRAGRRRRVAAPSGGIGAERATR